MEENVRNHHNPTTKRQIVIEDSNSLVCVKVFNDKVSTQWVRRVSSDYVYVSIMKRVRSSNVCD